MFSFKTQIPLASRLAAKLPSFLRMRGSGHSLSEAFASEKIGLKRFSKIERISGHIAAYERLAESCKELKSKIEAEPNSKLLKTSLRLKTWTMLRHAKWVLDRADVRIITQNTDDAILQQLMRNEKVHRVKDPEQFKRTRLGKDANSDKQCIVLAVDTNSGTRILSQIFKYRAAVPLTAGQVSFRDLPGDVGRIKNEDAKPFAANDDEVEVTTLFTVSAAWPGAGKIIDIANVSLNDDEYRTTLSPVRGFMEGKNREEELQKDPVILRQEVIEYLLTNKDLVLQTHLGKGAVIGDININPDDPSDWITINYVYPGDPGRRTLNSLMYKEHGAIYISDKLIDELNINTAANYVIKFPEENAVSDPSLSLAA